MPGETAQLWAELKTAHPQSVSNIKRYRKRLAQNLDGRFVSEASPAERPAVMAALARLHGLARARKGEGGNFRREGYRAFHLDLAEKLGPSGRLYLARLECNGEISAVLYGFVEGGVLSFYQSGFDTRLEKLGIGKLLMAAVLEDAVERLTAREFDFLRGDEAYKARWCTQARQTRHLYIWGAGAAAQLHHLAWRARRGLMPLRSWAGRRLGRSRQPLAGPRGAGEPGRSAGPPNSEI
ncbi:MAG: GNAT family N-acetyltransferase [Terriglobales bacterium]